MHTSIERSLVQREDAPSLRALQEPVAETFPPAWMMLRDGRLVRLRASQAGDAAAVQTFVRGLSPASRRNRFFSPVHELSAEQLACVTRVRDPRDLQLVAETAAGAPRIVAMAQHAVGENNVSEFALVVDDLFQRQGLGIGLLRQLARHAVRAQVAAFEGLVLADNWPMLSLAARLGFELSTHTEAHVMRAVRPLEAHGL